MSEKVINIAREFSRFPGPRHAEDGPKSGEEFRDILLAPRLEEAERAGDRIIVVLDGARGYTASFLEEAFGGLVRLKGFTKERLANLLEVRTSDPSIRYWTGRIHEYIDEAQATA